MNMKLFAERVKELRIEKGLSVRDLAKTVGIPSHGSIVHWENAKRMPMADAVSKLARFFGVSSDYLMGNED